MTKKWLSNIIENAIPAGYANSNFGEIIKIFLDIMQEEKFSDNGVSPINMINNFDEILNTLSLSELDEISMLNIPVNTQELIRPHLKKFMDISYQYYQSKGTIKIVNFYRHLIGDFSLNTIESDNEILKKLGIPVNESITRLLNDDIETHIPNTYLLNVDDVGLDFFHEVIKEIRPLGVLFILYSNSLVEGYNTRQYIDNIPKVGLCLEKVKTKAYCSDIGYQENKYTLNIYTIEELTGVTYQDAIDQKLLNIGFNSCIELLNPPSPTILDFGSGVISGDTFDISTDIIDLMES
jgi:hypothetical protein